MRLNIIRHKEKLLKCLGDNCDPVLKNKILKSYPNSAKINHKSNKDSSTTVEIKNKPTSVELKEEPTELKIKEEPEFEIIEDPKMTFDKIEVLQKNKEIDKLIKNARERAAQKRLSKLYFLLSKMCHDFATSKRHQSQNSILTATIREVDMLKNFEKKFIIQKNELSAENAKLKKRIRELNLIVRRNINNYKN